MLPDFTDFGVHDAPIRAFTMDRNAQLSWTTGDGATCARFV